LDRRRVVALGLIDEVVDRLTAHLVVRQRDGGEGGPEVGGDKLLVVEADDRDVLGDS